MRRKIGTVLAVIGGAALGGIIGITFSKLVIYFFPIVKEIVMFVINSSFGVVCVLALIAVAAFGIGIYLERK